jgi:hypothetical protein
MTSSLCSGWSHLDREPASRRSFRVCLSSFSFTLIIYFSRVCNEGARKWWDKVCQSYSCSCGHSPTTTIHLRDVHGHEFHHPTSKNVPYRGAGCHHFREGAGPERRQWDRQSPPGVGKEENCKAATSHPDLWPRSPAGRETLWESLSYALKAGTTEFQLSTLTVFGGSRAPLPRSLFFFQGSLLNEQN